MTKNDKTPATGVEQRTPSSSKKATTITDHFKASGTKKGQTKPEKPTKTPPVPVTDYKNTAKNNTGSPTVAKDLQEQFNNDPMQKRSSEQDDSISVNSQNSKKSYATAVKGDTSTEKEDFLTSDGFTLLQKDKRKRNKIASPSKSLASPTQKQSKLFLLGNSPYRHSKDNDKIQATPETEQPETLAQPNPDQDTFKPQPTMKNQVKPTAPQDLNHKKNNVGFTADNNPGEPDRIVKMLTVETHFFETINASLPIPMNTEEYQLVRNCGTRQFLRKCKVDVHSDIPAAAMLPSPKRL